MKKGILKFGIIAMLAMSTSVMLNSCGGAATDEAATEETKCEAGKDGETKCEGDKKCEGEAKCEGDKKCEGEAKCEGDKKCEGDAKCEGDKKEATK